MIEASVSASSRRAQRQARAARRPELGQGRLHGRCASARPGRRGLAARRSRSRAAGCPRAAAAAARRSARRRSPAAAKTSATVSPSGTVSRCRTILPLSSSAMIALGRRGRRGNAYSPALSARSRPSTRPRARNSQGCSIAPARPSRRRSRSRPRRAAASTTVALDGRPGRGQIGVELASRPAITHRAAPGRPASTAAARSFSARALIGSDGQCSGARTKIRLALVPPKPNEFDSAARTSRSLGLVRHQVEVAARRTGRPD